MSKHWMQTSKFVLELCIRLTNSLYHEQNKYLEGTYENLWEKEAELRKSYFCLFVTFRGRYFEDGLR